MESHAAKARANRPLYPAALEAPSEVRPRDFADDARDWQQQELPVPAVDVPADRPYAEAVDDDIVSHVEALPGCHEPVYETVHAIPQ